VVPAPESTDTLLKAILALMVDEREARPASDRERRTEVLLASAGLGASEIAELTGKQPGAVRMALSRARRTAGGPSDG
jgi:DNA-directed RNA polymerase specialized sigma24 family protein